MNRFKRCLLFSCAILMLSLIVVSCGGGEDGPDVIDPFEAVVEVGISTPAAGSTANQDEAITFQAAATSETGREIPEADVIWESDIDGLIGIGNTFSRSGLSVGTHTITVTAETEEASGSSEFELTIMPNQNLLSVRIIEPVAGSSIGAFDLVTLHGVVSAPDGSTISALEELSWESSSDGILGNGASIEPGNLTPGTQTMELIARIEYNGQILESRASTQIFVDFSTPNGMSAEILQPISGTSLQQLIDVTYTGFATDSDGNSVTGTDLVWTSSIDGVVGLGETCIVQPASAGIHRITMSVTGPDESRFATSVVVEVIE